MFSLNVKQLFQLGRYVGQLFQLGRYVFSYFPFGFGGGMWDLIVSVPDHCLSFYFSWYAFVYRGSYMSAHVLSNLLNALGKKIRCETLPSILSELEVSL